MSTASWPVRETPLVTPAISVIMAVRDAERFLDEAVASVLAQTRQDFEVIAVDDGSTDRSPDLLARWVTKDARIRVVRQEPRGLAAALNHAASLARGVYLARHDADDVSHPERFTRQIERLGREPDLGVLGSAIDVIDEDGLVVGALPVPRGREAARHGIVTARLQPVHGSMVMRRAVFERVGGYREMFDASQDFDLWLRVLEAGVHIDTLAEPLYRWRRHADSVSSRRRDLQIRSAGVMLAFAEERRHRGTDSYAELVAAGGDFEVFAKRYARRGHLHALWGELLYRALGDPRLARRHLARALAHGYVRPRSVALLAWASLGLPWPARRAT
jgi:glycosyltransferase involved in cell wall biosynthesis